MQSLILKHALKNALDFGGSVNINVVLGAVLKEDPSLKKDVNGLRTEISKVVSSIQKLSSEQIEKKLKELAPNLLKKEVVEETPLKPLPEAVVGRVVLRLAPSPSGPLHIGHVYGFSLNYEYAKMYKGKLLLRLEDTNAENIYPPAYKMIEDDVQWMTENSLSNVVVQSSRLPLYHKSVHTLIEKGKAYVCTCDADSFRELKNKGIACPCRDLLLKEHLLRYEKMFDGYKEGEVVVRLKTDIKDKNPAMRDFGIMRIVEHAHPKTGTTQKVWPLMVLSVAIDDHELGITHVLNGKDQADNAVKEKLIMSYLGWQPPQYKHWGFINFEGFEISKTTTKLAIEQGKYHGWDDIRLPFLPALRRRGYQAGAFRRFACEIGLSLNDKTVKIEEFWKNINAFNREIIEPIANRYFFVEEPISVVIQDAPTKDVELDLHPSFPARGKRKLKASGKVYITSSDQKNLEEGKIHRLMDYCNFVRKKDKYIFHSLAYEEYKNSPKKGLIIHWLPQEKNLVNVHVLLADGKVVIGYGEELLKDVAEGAIIQLERCYFARIDKKEKNNVYVWYTHT